MEGSSVLHVSPSYLRRPESYDRLRSDPHSGKQRLLANRLLLATATGTTPGKRLHTILVAHGRKEGSALSVINRERCCHS